MELITLLFLIPAMAVLFYIMGIFRTASALIIAITVLLIASFILYVFVVSMAKDPDRLLFMIVFTAFGVVGFYFFLRFVFRHHDQNDSIIENLKAEHRERKAKLKDKQ